MVSRASAAAPQTTEDAEPIKRRWRVVIVGSGFSGLGLAIRLKQQGHDDFVIIERNHDIGGTWLDNTYPGAGCDVPSNLYSFAAEPNPDWSRAFATQPEILRYMLDVADRHGVRENHIFGCELTDARWNESESQWDLKTSKGPFTADLVVCATGGLCEPKYPDIPGLEDFDGPQFHSARWDHDTDLTNKRVAVIGTGASAVQIVPSIAPDVARLDVYQRSAPWLMPKLDRAHTRPERLAYRYLPWLQRLLRAVVYLAREGWIVGHTKFHPAMALFTISGRVKLWWEVRDRELRDKVRPRDKAGCKRMLPSNTYYPALSRDNVEVITDGIAEIRKNSIVTTDGTERDVDAIILCTGFLFETSRRNDIFRGRDGTTIREDIIANKGAFGYKGSVLPNFPNLFIFLGPNSALGSSSALYMIESQVNYIADGIATFEKSELATVEVRTRVVEEYNREIQRMTAGSVWVSGCRSWFLDSYGRNIALWPDFSFRYRKRLRKFDVAAYDVTHRSTETLTDEETVA